MKATNWKISKKFLDYKSPKKEGFVKPKWIQFCESLIETEGLVMRLYEARHTNSKYITLTLNNSSFKVRFSDHKPIKYREEAGDCDFFVGVTNLGVSTTDQALIAVQEWIKNLPQKV